MEEEEEEEDAGWESAKRVPWPGELGWEAAKAPEDEAGPVFWRELFESFLVEEADDATVLAAIEEGCEWLEGQGGKRACIGSHFVHAACASRPRPTALALVERILRLSSDAALLALEMNATILANAVFFGVELTELILRWAPRSLLTTRNHEGETPLVTLAQRWRCRETFQLLAEAMEPEEVSLSSARSPSVLHEAINFQKAEALLVLVEKLPYEQLSAQDPLGRTLLHLAMRSCPLQVLLALLDALDEALLLHQDCDGNTVLHTAVKDGTVEQLQAIIGVMPPHAREIRNHLSLTALELAEDLQREEVVRFLIPAPKAAIC